MNSWGIPSLRVALACTLAYIAFFIHAAVDADGFLILDNVNLLFHEGGHFLLGFLGLISGTIGELIFPIATFVTFLTRKELLGITFGIFWIGEDLRYIGRYIADARTQALPLVGTGEHDWNTLLIQWDILEKDRAIGGTLTALSWLLMIGAVIMLIIVCLIHHFHDSSRNKV